MLRGVVAIAPVSNVDLLAPLIPGTAASVVTKLAAYGNPAASASSAPVLIVQGTADEAVPFDITAGPLVDQLQTSSQPVEFVPVDGANHDGAVFATVDRVAAWIEARFA